MRDSATCMRVIKHRKKTFVLAQLVINHLKFLNVSCLNLTFSSNF